MSDDRPEHGSSSGERPEHGAGSAESAEYGGAGSAEPAEYGSGSAEPPAHDDAGLELARAIARALAVGTAGGTPRSGGAARGRPRERRTRARSSGAHPDDRDPQTLDATIDRLVSEHGWSTDVAVHGVFGRWDSIVGAEVAQHCRPERFADARLTVRADSTAWATQVRLLAPTVVRRLNEELGDDTVVRIEVLGPNRPSWTKGGRGLRDARGPRDTYG